MSKVILSMNNVSKSYQTSGSEKLMVLDSIDLTIFAGDLVGLTAPSGAGKSTLLHVCGLLDTCDGGIINFLGKDIQDESDITRTLMRRRDIGFIYQFHHLLPEFSALENIMLPQLINGAKNQQASDRATELLNLVGLEHLKQINGWTFIKQHQTIWLHTFLLNKKLRRDNCTEEISTLHFLLRLYGLLLKL